MVMVWKILASVVASMISFASGLAVLALLAWASVGGTEARKQAVESVMSLGLLNSLIFCGLSIWQIWTGKISIGLVWSVGAWLFFLIVLVSPNSIINLFYRGG